MKKIIFALFAIALMPISSNAAFIHAKNEIINAEQSAKIQKRIDEIGFNILNSNMIDKRMVFDYNTARIKNASTRNSDRQITLYRDLYNRLENDDEVAAILAHEISHAADSYQGAFRGYFSGVSYYFAPKKYEYKADKRAVDYMIKSGYNPIAFIIVMNKTMPQERYDWCSTHPLTSRRMMEVYEYIYKKYPQYLVDNKYKENLYYQNFLLTSQQNRKKFQSQIQSNSNNSPNYL